MTLYVLAGGNDRLYSQYGENLGRLVKDSVKSPIKVLSCQFAKDEEEWKEVFKVWEKWFSEYFGADTESQLASPEIFLEQIDWADVVYLHGGHTWKQEAMIKKYTDLEKHFQGKIVIGSSAGANFLSKTYFSPKRNLIGQGSGITEINSIVHFGSESDGEISLTKEDWKDVLVRMQKTVGNESVTPIPEGEFISVEK